eukprot:gene27866-30916_t
MTPGPHMPDRRPLALVWLRRDLRLDDHAALSHALRSGAEVLPVFVFDTEILDLLPRADRRVEFIHGTIAALKAELAGLGSDLCVRHGRADEIIPELARDLGATAVYVNRDYEPATIARDARVAERLRGQGIEFHSSKDQVVLEQDEVLTAAGGCFTVFSPYQRAWQKHCDEFQLLPYPVSDHVGNLAKVAPEPMPTLESLGFERTNLARLGVEPGPAGAAKLLADFLA